MTRYYEDFEIGDVAEYGDYTISKEEILEFANRWDPEPYHTDEEFAKTTIFGGLIGSGVHLAAIWRKLNAQHLSDAATQASPGWDDLTWHKPVLPNDRIRIRSEITDKRLLASRPGIGIMWMGQKVFNQRDELMMSFVGKILIRTRPVE